MDFDWQFDRVAQTRKMDLLRSSLRDMLKYFGKYPEFIPAPEHADRCAETIAKAQRILDETSHYFDGAGQ